MKKLKRFIAACFAMNGILASGVKLNGDTTIHPDTTAIAAFRFADEILKQETL